MKRLILLVVLVFLTAGLVLVHAQTPPYVLQGTVNLAPSSPRLTAVDPLAYAFSSDVIPARPFLYTVDKKGITITRFNDNKVVGTWLWPKAPDLVYTVLPNGSFTGLTPPAEWEPVAMMVSYPTEAEFANRVKEVPDLTPPFTFVYVVMAHSGYQWTSSGGAFRDTIAPMTDAANESAMLIQIDVSDPSFSTRNDGAAPVYPHVAAALLGHGAGQPIYNRATGNVYVGNLPSTSLPPALSSFVSAVRRIPDTVASQERETPGVGIPVIRCGPQHPEGGIPLGRPQAYACYDPSGVHPIDDNEHVGAYGNFDWEFRNLPDWLKVGYEIACAAGTPAGVHCSKEGILYGTPPTIGEWFAEARVHNLDDEWGIFSYWAPVRLLVTPTAEYLPIRAEFAAGVPVAYPLEGTGDCTLTGAPAWVQSVQVPNGCVVMGKAPIDGEYYQFTMPGFSVAGYPGSLVFSGNVFGQYGFIPLPQGVGLSGLAWHQVSKVADPSTETAILSLEYIGVEPATGQLYHILAPPGRPQPPNERPPETELTLHVVSPFGAPLAGLFPGQSVAFGEVAVEADRDIFVAAVTNSPDGGAVVKVSNDANATRGIINLAMQPSSLSLDSDLRTAIPGVEPGQVDHNRLWVSGSTGSLAVIDTAAGTVSQTLDVAGATSLGSVSADFGTQWAYVVSEATQSVAIFGPAGSVRPPMRPRIWSYDELAFSIGYPSVSPEPFQVMATGDGIPTLTLIGELPTGLSYADNGDGTATITGTPTVGGEFAFTLLAEGSSGTYARSFGITVYEPATFTSPNTATFVAGSPSSFTVTTDPDTAVMYTWDEALMPPGVMLIDNENGTASLVGTAEAAGTYTFTIGATTSYPVDAQQVFTLEVVPAGTTMAPVITSGNTATWAVVGAPFSPDNFAVTSIGSPTPALSIVSGTLPPGVAFIDNHDSTGTLGAGCVFVWPTQPPSCLGTLLDGALGTWTFTIRATNPAGYADQTFTLIVERNTTILSATPAALSFAYTAGGTIPAAENVVVSSIDPLLYAVVTTASWLKVTPMYGTTPTNLTIAADPSGLAAGTYTGTVLVTSSETEGPFGTIAVTLNVSDVPAMGVTPSALSFQYRVVDGITPPAQTLMLASGGVPMNYTVSSGAPWLSATTTGSSTPGSVNVSVNASALRVGTYISAVTIASGRTVSTIPVTLVKTWSGVDLFNPAIDFMLNVGGEGFAINLNTHQLYINAAMEAAGGAAEAGGESGSEPAESEPIVPTTVIHVNPIDKILVAAIGVHSEGEYVAVNSNTGRVYHASQGTGEVAVIDGSKDAVLEFIPLMWDGFVFQPYQIAIDEAQNLIYVGAKAPPIPDPPHVAPFPCKAIHEVPDDEYDCWNPGRVFAIDGETNKIVSSFIAGDDPEGVVFAAATNMVYASNEDDGSITVAQGAVRNADGSIGPPQVLSTIIRGRAVPGTWHPTCDANNYCGERGQAALWPERGRCNGIDDEAEEADKMTVDPLGNVYIIDDRSRVAKIKAGNGCSAGCGVVEKVVEIEGFDCPVDVPDGSSTIFRNTANNIAFSAPDAADPTTWRLFVISEQNTFTVIDPVAMTIRQTVTIPDAVELDAAKADPALNRLYISDEGLATLWILQGACVDGNADTCTQPKDPADFVLGAAPGTQAVNAGSSGQYSIAIETSPTFNSTVTFQCSTGLPRGAACSFSPASVTPGPNGVATIVMTITTTSPLNVSAYAPLQPRGGVFFATLMPMVGLVLGGFATARRQRLGRRTVLLLMLIGLLLVISLALAGCGSGSSPALRPPSSNPAATPAGTYAVTVTANSATVSHTTNVTLTVH